MARVRIGVDVGGTFTDLVTVHEGRVVTAKVPSTVTDQSVGVMECLRRAGVEGATTEALAHGTTIATNALLERTGARTALITTSGFRDVIEVGRQNRPSLYDLTRDRPEQLVPRDLRLTVRGRMGPQGEVEPLDEASLEAVVEALSEADVEAAAVCLLFSFLHDDHEAAVARAVRERLPDVHVSVSSEMLPEFREYERTSTTVADAYLGPRLRTYLGNLARALADEGFFDPLVMQSSGGVIPAADAGERAAACLLSGPAAGVVGGAYIATAAGYTNALTFDMGGTSTDVAAIREGASATTTETVVAGVAVRFPAVDVHTVSAGGGSIAWVDAGGALRVGPRSAGASPGPACYGRGGTEPTVTDANLLLGYLADEAVLGGDITLDRAAAEEAVARLGRRVGLEPLDAAAGIIEVANAEMIKALRLITVQRGHDPRDSVLVAFGGAGPMHGCALAAELGIDTVLVPLAGGVLSALGLAITDLRRDYVRSVHRLVDEADAGHIEGLFAAMEEQARSDLREPELARHADLRYKGQSHELDVASGEPGQWNGLFEDEHRRRFGYAVPGEPVEVVAVRVTARQPVDRPPLVAPGAADVEAGTRRAFFGDWEETPVVARASLGEGAEVAGPCIVEFEESTCVVPPGWNGEVHETGTLVLTAP